MPVLQAKQRDRRQDVETQRNVAIECGAERDKARGPEQAASRRAKRAFCRARLRARSPADPRFRGQKEKRSRSGASVDSCPLRLPAQSHQPRQHQRIIRMGPSEVARESVAPERARAKQESRPQVPDGPRAFVAMRIVCNRAQEHRHGQRDGQHEQGGQIPGDCRVPSGSMPNASSVPRCLASSPSASAIATAPPVTDASTVTPGPASTSARKYKQDAMPAPNRCRVKTAKRYAATSAAAAETSNVPGRIRPATSRPGTTATSLLVPAGREPRRCPRVLEHSQMIGLQQASCPFACRDNSQSPDSHRRMA